jgi:hypothetical protein
VNWFAWRQHRKQFLVFGILLVAFTALVIPTGIHFWHTYQQALATCTQNPNTPNCNDLQDNILTSGSDALVMRSIILGAFAFPLLVALFIGSPLIASEYAEGTNKLAWTQSISRRKWLTTKLAWTLGFALLYGITVTLLVTWWSRTENVLHQFRFIQGHFETQGLMPAAYALFFTAFAIAMSAWFRKTLVALALTFGVFILFMIGFGQWIRPHYATPVTVTSAMAPNAIEAKIPVDAWTLKRNIIDNHGNAFDSFSIDNMPTQCQKLTQDIRVPDGSRAAKVKAQGGDPVDDCLNSAGYRQTATYQPEYRYWDFQRIETGIYLGMTALAIGATYWLVLKRDA